MPVVWCARALPIPVRSFLQQTRPERYRREIVLLQTKELRALVDSLFRASFDSIGKVRCAPLELDRQDQSLIQHIIS